jgi:hypothetical protein
MERTKQRNIKDEQRVGGKKWTYSNRKGRAEQERRKRSVSKNRRKKKKKKINVDYNFDDND